MRLSRRQHLASLVALLAGAPAAAQTVIADPRPRSREASLAGFMQLFSGVAGACAITNDGVIYGQEPGGLMQPLVGYLSLLEIRPEQIAPHVFRTRQMEAMVYLDLRDGTLLETWTNPFTGREEIPVGYVSPENVYWFDLVGSYARTRPAVAAAPTLRDWRTDGIDIWVTEQRFNSFPAGITAEEFPRAFAGPVRNSVDVLTYRARIADFANAAAPFTPASMTMVTDAPWPLWMMMGARPGRVIWHGHGMKRRSLAETSDASRALIERAYPGFLADPWRFPAAQWGTAAQLRRLRDQGRLRRD